MKSEETYEISYKEAASQEEIQVLIDGISNEAFTLKGMGKIVPFSFFARDSEGTIIAGIQGSTYYGCLYTDWLFVGPAGRNKGLGTKLMGEAEKLGRERKCTFATLFTMDWEALSFYQKVGYHIEHIREGFEKKSTMYFLRKAL